MIAYPQQQLTTEAKLLCSAIIIAGLFEEGRILPANPADVEADKALRTALEALLAFQVEANNWPEAIH